MQHYLEAGPAANGHWTLDCDIVSRSEETASTLLTRKSPSGSCIMNDGFMQGNHVLKL